jgi:hypothetical protein
VLSPLSLFGPRVIRRWLEQYLDGRAEPPEMTSSEATSLCHESRKSSSAKYDAAQRLGSLAQAAIAHTNLKKKDLENIPDREHPVLR